jgi:hypothetical protein
MRIAIANYSWISRTFHSQPNHSGGRNHALVLVLKTKLQFSFDWFMSSSKFQRCLELCRFAQALLKTKVARWKAHFLVRISKRPMYTICWNGWHITRGTQPERRLSHLESHCYNKLDPGPKTPASLNLDEHKSFLVCSKPYLTSPSIVYISSTPN